MRSTLPLIFLFSMISASAQIDRREVRTDSGTVVLHHFEDGTVSTLEWMDPEGRWGRSIAYDKSGKEIYNGQTRRFAGNASVDFRYHSNGAVSRVEYSSAPDGGIQWHKSTTTFNEDGIQTGHSEYGHDNYGFYPRAIDVRQAPGSQETVECQRMFVNEVFLVNATRHAGKASVTPVEASPALKPSAFTIAPGDTVRLGSYSKGEMFPPPEEHLTVEVSQARLKRRKIARARMELQEVQVATELKRYYLVISGWRKG